MNEDVLMCKGSEGKVVTGDEKEETTQGEEKNLLFTILTESRSRINRRDKKESVKLEWIRVYCCHLSGR